ncbi:MAG TPA: response regulator transcription factor [Gemmatimonadales bacterium]|nr:response regulator transcription factor [Gemmatimonadales bacterium]
MTRVLVAARAAVVRAGLESLLARGGAYVVLGTAATTRLADTVAETEPDVLLLALDDGEEAPLPLALPPDAVARQPAVVALGDEPLERWGPRALRAGARAVLPRSAPAEAIEAAIAAALAGLVVLPPQLMATANPIRTTAARSAGTLQQPLTARELEILQLLASGLGNKLVAARLGISEHTVKSHIAALYAKLGVSTRGEAVAAGVRLGLLML